MNYTMRCDSCTKPAYMQFGAHEQHTVKEFYAVGDDAAMDIAKREPFGDSRTFTVLDEEQIPIGQLTNSEYRFVRPAKEKAKPRLDDKGDIKEPPIEHPLKPEVYMGDIPLPAGKELLDFQSEAVREMIGMGNVLLGDEMGLGKTIQAIALMNTIRKIKEQEQMVGDLRVLIGCPNSLRINWFRELKEWGVGVISDDATEEDVFCVTQLYIPGMSNVVIATYEGLRRWAPLLSQEEWDLYILDEAHYCKNPSAQRTQAAFSIPARKLVFMTGTPILNFPYELFPLASRLQHDVWYDFPYFEHMHCRGAQNKLGYNLDLLQAKIRGEWTASLWAARKSKERGYYIAPDPHRGKDGPITRIPKLMIRRLKKDVLDSLPRKRRQVMEIPAEGRLAELVAQEKKLYASLEGKGIYDEILQQLDLVKDGGEDDEAFALVIESLKSSRRFLFEEISRVRHQLALAKVPEVVEHAVNILDSNGKLVVFAHHKDVCKGIREAIEKHWKESDQNENYAVVVTGDTDVHARDKAVQDFQNDENCRVFIGTMKAAGVGLTLTAAAHMVFAEMDWTPSTLTQAEDRCHRIGQEKSLLVQHLVVEGSMDAFMAKKVIAKQKSISKALNKSKQEF